MSKAVIRGGQLNIHNIRMLKQVVYIGILICLPVGLFKSYLFLKEEVPAYAWGQYKAYLNAEYNRLHPEKIREAPNIIWPEPQGITKTSSNRILARPYTQRLKEAVHHKLWEAFFVALRYAGISFIILGFFWFVKGFLSMRSKKLRGQRIVSAFYLKWLVRLKFKASYLKVEQVPLLKNSEVKHILVIGTTGSGKTNLLNDLLPQIAKRKNKVFIIDTTGDMVARYYRPHLGDVLINPFDKRSVYWDLLSDCRHEYQFDSLAQSIVPKNSEFSDPIWANGSATLLSVALQRAKEDHMSVPNLFLELSRCLADEFGSFFFNTDAYAFADPKGDKTTSSFKSNLMSNIQFFKHLDCSKERFSMGEWINDDNRKNWVFVSANEDQLSTLQPPISALFEVASTACLSLAPCRKRRIWFVTDELPALRRLKSLSALLSKGRKYGACVLSGLLSMSQFDKEYGHNEARTILNLYSTKFFFRSTEINACDQISRWLGEEEVEESKESLSYGAHEMRDGVSLNQQRQQRKLVLPVEISQLPDLMCYTQYPEDFPIAKVKMSFKKVPEKNAAFEEEIKQRPVRQEKKLKFTKKNEGEKNGAFKNNDAKTIKPESA